MCVCIYTFKGIHMSNVLNSLLLSEYVCFRRKLVKRKYI